MDYNHNPFQELAQQQQQQQDASSRQESVAAPTEYPAWLQDDNKNNSSAPTNSTSIQAASKAPLTSDSSPPTAAYTGFIESNTTTSANDVSYSHWTPGCGTYNNHGNALNIINNNNNSDSFLMDSSSCHSTAATWFALETTPEDRLSFHILQTELRDLVTELYHFFKNRHWKKKLLTVCVMLAAVCVFLDALCVLGDHSIINEALHDFLIWITVHPVAAEFAFVGIYVLATLLFIPPTLLLLGAGWAFAEAFGSLWQGVLAAVVACFMGSVVGGLLSFLRARYMARDVIELVAQRYPIIRAADAALQRDGFRILLLLRLCPLIPFAGLNVLGGISKVTWQAFVCSLVGVLPYQTVIIIMGASAGSWKDQSFGDDDQYDNREDDTMNEKEATEGQQMAMLLVMSMGIGTGVIAMILAFRFTKKELQKVGPDFLWRAGCLENCRKLTPISIVSQELDIGEVEMESYITIVRRMSTIFDGDTIIASNDGVEVNGNDHQGTEYGRFDNP